MRWKDILCYEIFRLWNFNWNITYHTPDKKALFISGEWDTQSEETFLKITVAFGAYYEMLIKYYEIFFQVLYFLNFSNIIFKSFKPNGFFRLYLTN